MLSKVVLPFAAGAVFMAVQGSAFGLPDVSEQRFAQAASAVASTPGDMPNQLDLANDRIRFLEERLVHMQRDHQAALDNVQALENKVRELEAARGANLVTYLLAALSIVLATALMAVLRGRGVKSRWWAGRPAIESEPAQSSQMGGDSSVANFSTWPPSVPPQPAAAPAPRPGVARKAVPPETDTHPAPFNTAASARPPGQTAAAPAAGGARMPDIALPTGDTSTVEDLIDLDQQAEFFTVLGQDDAAIELLTSHLQGSGGLATPLPYFRLLEIHHRRADREAFERTRDLFRQRFNADAPGWEADPAQGRSLETYPEVVGQLQSLWNEPTQAMHALQVVLWRMYGQGPLLELPAYREALFLYSVARDLGEQGADSSNVDLLLPLGGGTADNKTKPAGTRA